MMLNGGLFQFLVACTVKLNLGTYARVLYDWEGNEVNYLKDGKPEHHLLFAILKQ